MTIAGLVLAGGRGSRMGPGPAKPLLMLGDLPLVGHVIAAMPSEIRPLAISANDPDAFVRFGLPVIPDRTPGFGGPLAGIDAAGAFVSEHHPEATRLLVVSGDTPFLDPKLLLTLAESSASPVRIAYHAGRLHPTIGIWTIEAVLAVGGFLRSNARHSLQGFLDDVGFEAIALPGSEAAPGGDPFFNVNTPEDLQVARDFLRLR